jgi:hypothetical protein
MSNRHQRRAAAAPIKRLARKSGARQTAKEAICLARGHVLAPAWVMRPALVGAGIVIPKVHFDRNCGRCGKLDSVWADIEGDVLPQPESLSLAAWLLANGATVSAPAGDIRVPNQTELDRIAKIVRRAAE